MRPKTLQALLVSLPLSIEIIRTSFRPFFSITAYSSFTAKLERAMVFSLGSSGTGRSSGGVPDDSRQVNGHQLL
jgi:hypothetical protein